MAVATAATLYFKIQWRWISFLCEPTGIENVMSGYIFRLDVKEGI
jgi:hypothetical protein